MQEKLKVSIITITYNSGKTLEDTIRSVKGQDYSNIEYIIVDGGSSDSTLNIISANRADVNIFISEKDNGIYDAMNKGIRRATGDIIGILNSDDLYQDNKVIPDVMACFNNDASLDIVYGDLVYVKSTDTSKIVRKWQSKPYYDSFFENGNVPAHPTLFLKKEVYQKAGLFNLQYRLASDYEFMLRLFKKHSFKPKYLKRLMVRMRLGGATNKSVGNIKNGNLEIINAWKNNGLKVPPFFMMKRLVKRLKQFI